ncbi:serum amyloid A [Clinocottus analis]|uniref:serum amyloid A n=1 Tax=Clinocottus analis TaxID=304258 RepID=UPI0035C25AA4
MKLFLAGIVLILSVEANAQWYKFPVEAAQGTHDMYRAYTDMKDANWKQSDHYFHARGNSDAAKRGEGGRWAAEVISNAREWIQERTGQGAEDTAADQRANAHGRNGGDPNDYRPRGLPEQY